jgi:hypothetical protein
MPVTIHINLLNGQILNFRAPGRNRVMFPRVEKTMRDMVLEEMKLDHTQYKVKFIHEDDEEKLEALRKERAKLSLRTPSKSGISYETMNDYARDALQTALDQERTYEDGATVHALVEEKYKD